MNKNINVHRIVYNIRHGYGRLPKLPKFPERST